jgi:hypothetical protein
MNRFLLVLKDQNQINDFLDQFVEYLIYVSMLNDVSNVPFDRIYYYISDIHNFVVLDDKAYVAKINP